MYHQPLAENVKRLIIKHDAESDDEEEEEAKANDDENEERKVGM
jgi:hypothetical protein